MTCKRFYLVRVKKNEIRWTNCSVLKDGREKGPAHILFDQKNNIKYISWRKEGKLHRTDGPALVYEKTKKYYYNDQEFKDLAHMKMTIACF